MNRSKGRISHNCDIGVLATPLLAHNFNHVIFLAQNIDCFIEANNSHKYPQSMFQYRNKKLHWHVNLSLQQF